MSLFDKLKNKRSSLQEKTDDTTGRGKKPIKVNLKNLVDKAKKNPLNKNLGVKITDTNTIKQSEVSKKAKDFTKNINKKRTKKVFPGDKSGAYQATKTDIETRKGFSKNKPGGLKADETNKFVKRSVRKARVDKLGGDIYDQPKFSQKQFDKSIGGAKKPADVAAPGSFGKGDTKGQMNVKAMDKKAFKVTKPKDVKLPKSFSDFQKNLQDYKDRDKATMRTGKSSSKVKVSGGKNLSRQDVGMAPPDKPKTKVVKQSEVSKQAKDFTKAIDKARTKTPVTSNKTFSKFAKEAETAKNKFRKQVDTIVKNPKLTGSEKAKQSRPVMKKVTGAAEVEKGYKLASKGKGTPGVTPIVKSSNLDLVKGTKPTATVGGKSKGTTPVKVNISKLDTSVGTRTPRTITKQTKALMSKQQTFAKSAVGKGLKKNLPTVYKAAIKNPIARTAVKKGGLPAVVGLGLLSSPTVRKGIKYALAGGTIGAFAGNKDKKAVLGPKTSGKPVKFNLSPAAKSNSNKSKYTAGVYGRPKAYS